MCIDKNIDIQDRIESWKQFLGNPEHNWQQLVAGQTSRNSPCGLVYELENFLQNPNESFAIVDMRNLTFAEPHYHTHDETEIYIVLQGSACVVVGNQEKYVSVDDVIVTPANVAHYVIPDNQFVIVIINTPPFNPKNYVSLTKSDESVTFDNVQFEKLVREIKYNNIDKNNLNIVCITHADFETPGVIEEWAFKNKYNFKIVKPYKGESLPNEDSFDFLIIMGGPQSPLKINESPYLSDEIKLIALAISKNKKVLGFCLGAQLISEALGARTICSPEKEVGVFPVSLTDLGKNNDILQTFPDNFNVIHWHNDMPGLTDDCIVLASSKGCPRQIIQYSKHVYGFQCHLEITLNGIKTMIEAAPKDLEPSKYTQTEYELLVQDYETINAMMLTILDRFVQL